MWCGDDVGGGDIDGEYACDNDRDGGGGSDGVLR